MSLPASDHRLRVHAWECGHLEVVDHKGERVDWLTTADPAYTTEQVDCPYACPICSDPNGVHVYMVTKPRLVLGTTRTRPEFWLRGDPPTQTVSSRLDPSASSFVPNVAPTAVDSDLETAEKVTDPCFGPFNNTAAQPGMHNRATRQMASQQQPYRSHAATAYPQQRSHHLSSVNSNNAFSRSSPQRQAPLNAPTAPAAMLVPAPSSGSPSKAPTAPAAMLASALPSSSPSKTRPMPHKTGKPCPDANAECHWHYGDWCHEQWQGCEAAHKAIRVAWDAKRPWKGAPIGWNEEHEACLRDEDPVVCPFHRHIISQRYGRRIR